MTQISVLVAHSRRLFAEAITLALGSHQDLNPLGEHPATGPQAVDMAEIYRPDVLLIDYWMEGMLAPAVIQAVRQVAPDTKVLILSWFHGQAEIENSLLSGAAGFLPESVGFAQVADAVREAARGETPVYPEQLQTIVTNLEKRSLLSKRVWERLRTITRRELEILVLLSTGLGLQQIASELTISHQTVRKHVENMLMKTDTHTQAELLAMVRAYGLIGG